LVIDRDFFHTLPAFDTSVSEEDRQNIAIAFSTKKTRMVWLPENEKKFEDTITHFDGIYKRVRRPDTTDRQRDRRTLHDGIDRGYAQRRAAKIRSE